LLERDAIGSGDTYCTTAHLTYVTDMRLSEIAKVFGKQAAGLVWHGGAAAINTIEEISQREEFDCEFRRIPGFLHASLENDSEERKSLQADCQLAREFGFEAAFVESAPIVGRPAIRFANVAKFQPLKFVAGVAKAAGELGCEIFEHSEAMEFEEEPRVVKVNGKQIGYDYIVLATHVPLMGKTGLVNATLLQTKLYPYSSYVVRAKISGGDLPEASFWDTTEPYYYLRIDRTKTGAYAIFGGLDHKTGQADDMEERYQKLEAMLRRLIPNAKVDRQWTGQVIETNDGLPYIGETAEKQFAATGFAGNGMTFGTLSAMMATDAVLGRENPWADLFSVNRKKIRGGVWDYVTENVDYPYYMLRDWLKGPEAEKTSQVKRGEGKILQIDGERVACSRDEKGQMHAVSAVCTHMGCLVHWNSTEHTWDCPCHGSRFEATGEVIAGPAEQPLEPVHRDLKKGPGTLQQPVFAKS
jgi:glycine/D-amino acid oxidase-like deaminating enzyme/nitrite reductase/ring-hydroxylating ferredoxin subunit